MPITPDMRAETKYLRTIAWCVGVLVGLAVLVVVAVAVPAGVEAKREADATNEAAIACYHRAALARDARAALADCERRY